MTAPLEFPISFEQEGQAFQEAFYAEQKTFMVTGVMPVPDVGRSDLEAALARVVAGHAALRTSVDPAAGVQVVWPEAGVEVGDEAGPPAGPERLATLRRALSEIEARPFDRSDAARVRAHLVRSPGGSDAHLVYAVDHIVCDASGQKRVEDDLLAELRRPGDGRPAAPDYGRYAAAQREAAEREGWLAREAAYWDEALSGCHAVPRLDATAPAGLIGDYEQHAHVNDVRGTDLVARLHRAGRQLRVTPTVLLTTLFAAVTCRFADQPDLPLSMAMTTRASPTDPAAVGCFHNHRVLRIHGDATASFAELCAANAAAVRAGYAHRRVALTQLMGAVPDLVMRVLGGGGCLPYFAVDLGVNRDVAVDILDVRFGEEGVYQANVEAGYQLGLSLLAAGVVGRDDRLVVSGHVNALGPVAGRFLDQLVGRLPDVLACVLDEPRRATGDLLAAAGVGWEG